MKISKDLIKVKIKKIGIIELLMLHTRINTIKMKDFMENLNTRKEIMIFRF